MAKDLSLRASDYHVTNVVHHGEHMGKLSAAALLEAAKTLDAQTDLLARRSNTKAHTPAEVAYQSTQAAIAAAAAATAAAPVAAMVERIVTRIEA